MVSLKIVSDNPDSKVAGKHEAMKSSLSCPIRDDEIKETE
jgi:hypothetical protein